MNNHSQNNNNQIEHEIRVFKMYSQITPYSIIESSIEKRNPPEPDIRCKLEDGSSIAFELVECIDNRLAQRFGDTFKIENALYDYLKKLEVKKREEFKELFKNDLIYVNFNEKLAFAKKKLRSLKSLLFFFPLDTKGMEVMTIHRD